MLKQHRVKILKAIARILFSYAYSIEKAVSKESSPEQQPVEYSSNDTPPAHWLEKVRQGAPHLLEQSTFEYPAMQSTMLNQEYVADTNEAITTKTEKEIASGPENSGKNKQLFSIIKTIYRLVHVKQPESPSHNKENRANKTLQLHPEENKPSGNIFSKKNSSEHSALKSSETDPDSHIDHPSTTYRLQQPDKINKQKSVSINNKQAIRETIKQPPIQLKPTSKRTTANPRLCLTKKLSPDATTKTKQTVIKLSPKQPFSRLATKHQVSVEKVEAEYAVKKNTKTVPVIEITENKEHSFSGAAPDEAINFDLKTQKLTQSVQTNTKKNKTFAWQAEDSDKHKVGIINHWPQLPEDKWLEFDNNKDQSIHHWQLQTEINNRTMSEHEQRGRLWNV